MLFSQVKPYKLVVSILIGLGLFFSSQFYLKHRIHSQINYSKQTPYISWTCTAFFINNQGYLATAGHCVGEDGIVGHKFYIKYNNIILEVKLVAVDFDSDVAIFKSTIRDTPYYVLNTRLPPDSRMYVLGYPIPQRFGYDLKMTRGVYWFSLLPDLILPIPSFFPGAHFYISDALACGGNSGGPTINDSGEVIGVLTIGLGTSECSNLSGSVKIQELVDLANKYHVQVTTAYLNSYTVFPANELYKQGLTKIVLFEGET